MQADLLRGELRTLRDGLALAQCSMAIGAEPNLLDVNERLTLTALYSERIAAKAIDGIDDLIHASQHDVLTGSANRALGRMRLKQEIDATHAAKSKLATVFVDIDDFKLINDSLGHSVGDQVLVMVARRLEAAVRSSDIVCRYGGEEFLIVLGHLSDTAAAAGKAEALLMALAEPNDFGICVSASLGIALFPDDGCDIDVLIEKADAAMYRAKRCGGGRFAFHHDGQPPVSAPKSSVLLLERQLSDLREANEQLILAALRVDERDAGQVARESGAPLLLQSRL